MSESATSEDQPEGPTFNHWPLPTVCITPVGEGEPYTYCPDDDDLISNEIPSGEPVDAMDDDMVCQSLDDGVCQSFGDPFDDFPHGILNKGVTEEVPNVSNNQTRPQSMAGCPSQPGPDILKRKLGGTRSLDPFPERTEEDSSAKLHLQIRRSKQGERFLNSIRRRNLPEVKSLQANSELRLHAYANQYGESAIESAVQSSSIAILDCIVLNTQLEERPKVIQRCMLFAIRDNKPAILQHLLSLYKETRKQWRRQGLESTFCKEDADVSAGEGLPTVEERDEEETGNDQLPTVSYFGSGNSATASVNTAGMKDRCNKPMDGWTLKRKIKKTSATSTSDVDEEIDDPAYSDHMTPLVLAAQLGRYELIKMLMENVSPDIHPISQGCTREKCMICQRSSFDGHRPIQDCRRSIEVFKALSSPSYLFIACAKDPILEAFLIGEASLRRKQQDVAFSHTYDAVLSNCHCFGTDLLALCRTSAEVLTLLNHKAGIEACNAKGHRARFPRIQLAIHYNQKSFVSHPHCQQVLMDAWSRGLPKWVNQGSSFRLLLYTLLMTVASPVTFAVYMFPVCRCFPVERIEKYIKEPAGKYLHDTVSYIIFLILLLMCTIYRSDEMKDHLFTGLEWLVLFWVLGLTARFGKMTYYRRNNICSTQVLFSIHSNWQIGDFLSLGSFWISYFLRFASWVAKINATGEDSSGPHNDTSTEVWTESNEVEIDERVEWDAKDPYLISEIFFATACILAVLHIFTLLKTNPNLGPLQVSLKQMTNAFVRFFVLFSIVMAAFSLGLTYLYSGYNNVTYNGEPVNVYMVTLDKTLKTLFWSLFGYGEADQADLAIENQGHRPTELVGYFVFGLYHVITVIFLANMLIAMVTNFYNEIEKNADEEWKFTMTQLRMSYFNEIGCLPPPLNLIPSRWLLKKLLKGCGRRPRTYEPERYINRDGEYPALMEKLQKRYWLNERMGSSKTDTCPKKDSKLFFDIVGEENV